MNELRGGVLILTLTTLAGCGSDSGGLKVDSSVLDSAATFDARDVTGEADSRFDSIAVVDTGSPDTGSPDTGSPDSGPRDSGSPDSGSPIDSGDAAQDVQADASTDGEQDGVIAGSCASRVVTVSTFCIENATARAGETVDVDAYLLVPAGCAKITQSRVSMTLPAGVSAETMDFSKDSLCRGLAVRSDGSYLLSQMSSSASTRCPVSLPVGLFRTVKLTLADTVAAGEYPLELSSPSIGDNFTATECRNGGGASLPVAPAISGTLTVRP